MRKKVLYIKIRIYLSYSSKYSPPELRHLSYRGISFCVSVSKKFAACELGHVFYCETQKALRRIIQKKRRGILTYGVVLRNDNALSHTPARTQALL
jgi:hypothetical protein